ncbi:MAG: glucose-6-phosphate isomerase, partial [Lachnospiraceae bacterium]
MNQFNWDTSFAVDFNLQNGFSKTAKTTKRSLSQMKEMFYDTDAAEAILKESDPLIYEFHELGAPERAGDLAL